MKGVDNQSKKAKYRIDFFQQWDYFDMLCLTNLGMAGITGQHRSVYMALLRINNNKKWAEVFEVDFQYIIDLARVDKDTYRKCMNFFNQVGLFDSYTKGINHYARATVSLKVLTEKSVSTLNLPTEKPTGKSVSNPVLPTEKPTADSVSTAHSTKKEEINFNNKREKSEGPLFDDIFNFFKENSVDKKWRVAFCEDITKKFISNYESAGWPKDWRLKAKNWIEGERNARTTDRASDGRAFPQTYSHDFFQSLVNKNAKIGKEDRDQYLMNTGRSTAGNQQNRTKDEHARKRNQLINDFEASGFLSACVQETGTSEEFVKEKFKYYVDYPTTLKPIIENKMATNTVFEKFARWLTQVVNKMNVEAKKVAETANEQTSDSGQAAIEKLGQRLSNPILVPKPSGPRLPDLKDITGEK